MSAQRKHRAGRLARGAAWVLGGSLLALVVVLSLALLSLRLPPVSRFAAAQVSAALEPVFRGRLVLRQLGRVGWGGVSGAEIEVLDPEGRSVLLARDVDVRMAWPRVLYRVLRGAEPLEIRVQRVGVDSIDVQILDDGQGVPTLARAFEPRSESEQDGAGGEPHVVIDQIELGEARVRGSLEAVGAIDVDLRQLRARLESDARGLGLGLEEVQLNARQLPVLERLNGQLGAELFLPSAPPAPAPEPPAAGQPSTQAYALRPREPRRVMLTFAGDVAGSPAALELQLRGEDLRAQLDAAAISPATLGELAPGLTAAGPLALSARVEGALADLGFDARLEQGTAQIGAQGRLRLEAAHSRASVRVEARDVDLSRWLEDAPRTRLSLRADAVFDVTDQGTRGTYRLASAASALAGVALPRTTVEGSLELPKEQPWRARGNANIAEPGAETRLTYRVSAPDAGLRARVSVVSEIERPPRLLELAGITARGSLTADAEYDAASERLDAGVQLRLGQVHHPGAQARALRASLVARGPVRAPQLHGTLDARRVEALGRSLSRVWMQARGTPERLNVAARLQGRDPDRIELETVLEPEDLRLLSPRISVQNRGQSLKLQARHVTLGGERLRVQGLTLMGPGRAQLSLVYGERLEQLELSTEQLRVPELLQMFGIQSDLRRASLNLRASVSGRGPAPSGTLRFDAAPIVFAEVTGAARGDLALERGRLSGDVSFDLAQAGSADLRLREVRLPLRAPNQRDLETWTGEVDLRGELDLAGLGTWLPLVGVEHAKGRVEYELRGGRSPGETPEWHARVESHALEVVGEREDTDRVARADEARAAAPWSVRGIDFEIEARLRQGTARLQGTFHDEQGALARLDASFRGIGVRSLRDPARALLQAPLEARVQVPPRALERLPPPIRPASITGTLALELRAGGTLQVPEIEAHASIDELAPAVERRRPVHLDLELDADYASTGGRIRLHALRERRPVLVLDSSWSGDARGFAADPRGRSPVVANLDMKLDAFPIGVIPALETSSVHANVSGHARLTNYGRDASFGLEIATERLVVDRLVVGDVRAQARAEGGRLEVSSWIEGRAGSLRAELSAPLTWNDRVLPSSNLQVEGTLQSRGFRLEALQPLLAGTIAELGGRLDSHVSVRRQAGRTEFAGNASLSDGFLQVPAMGQRFSGIEATLRLGPDRLRIDDLRARGLSGELRADASVQLEGLVPTSAEASVRIQEDEKLPITFEGESLGDVWGTFRTSYVRDEQNRTNLIRVQLDKLHVQLPAAPPQGITDLEQPEHIRVGYWRQDGEFVTIALQPIEEPSPPSDEKTVVVVDLGAVSLEKGQQVTVTLGGQIRALLGDELQLRGRIETKRGQLDISGKTFEIERGSVVFSGGPPEAATVNAVARYDSGLEYTVYAEYVGTLQEGTLNLSADPTLSQDQIVTLLLFGTPDGSLGAGTGDSVSTAVSVAGGTAVKGLNRAISNVTDLDVSARVDTSAGAPRPELVLQLSPRVAAKITQALGEPAPGQSPDRTFLTVDLRLASRWSLSTMVGDQGATALDLIWRNRY